MPQIRDLKGNALGTVDDFWVIYDQRANGCTFWTGVELTANEIYELEYDDGSKDQIRITVGGGPGLPGGNGYRASAAFVWEKPQGIRHKESMPEEVKPSSEREPPWKAFPEEPSSLRWRMGPGEDFIQEWLSFWRGLTREARKRYLLNHSPPREWSEWLKRIRD